MGGGWASLGRHTRSQMVFSMARDARVRRVAVSTHSMSIFRKSIVGVQRAERIIGTVTPGRAEAEEAEETEETEVVEAALVASRDAGARALPDGPAQLPLHELEAELRGLLGQ